MAASLLTQILNGQAATQYRAAAAATAVKCVALWWAGFLASLAYWGVLMLPAAHMAACHNCGAGCVHALS